MNLTVDVPAWVVEIFYPSYVSEVEQITIFATFVVIHFLGDFILQTDEMAMNKSESNSVLAKHCCMYSIPFILPFGVVFAMITAMSHFMVDYFSSRATSKLHVARETYKFFVVIGADQALHMLILLATYQFMFL